MKYLDIAREALESLGKTTPSALSDGRAEATPQSQAEEVALMGLDEFARAGLVVKVSSSIIGADVLFVSDNVPDSKISGDGLTVYRVNELRKLVQLRPNPEELRKLQEIKRIFGGTILDVESEEHQRSLR